MRRLALLLSGLLMLLACSLSSTAPAAPSTPTRVPLLPTTESTAKPTRPPVGAQSLPTQAPAATDAPLATLEPASSTPTDRLTDDFSDPGSGWDVSSGSTGSVGYENGEYVIQVDKADYNLWANPGRKFDDALVGVTVQPDDNSATADMGVICRYQDTDNFIYGEITSDGFYGITQMKNGSLKVLTGGGKLKSSDAIHKDTQANQLQLLCAGNRFVLIVNDQYVDAIEADASASGDVGLIAGTFEKSGARVRFDDFSAVLPPPNTEIGTMQPGGNVLFSDDFSDPQSGWDVRETGNGASGYQQGRYFIRVDQPKYQLWSSPGQSFKGDVVVEVTAGLASGPEENEMGVICRYQDRQNFLYGSIGTDGYYAIVEIKNDETTILTGNGKFQKSDAIPVSSETYNIRLACEGDRYMLFVNGEQIDSATGSGFTSGDVGLLAGTFDQGGVKVLFDDFTVSTP
jgi:hypothetical protein